MSLEFEITELNRRVANLLKLGQVKHVNYDGDIPLVRVQVGELLTTWLPLLSLRAGPDRHWWPVEINEQVLVLSPSGDTTQGVVLGSLHQQRFPAPTHEAHVHQAVYQDGAILEYDRQVHRLRIHLPKGAKTEWISEDGVMITGDITVEGHITASGHVFDGVRSMQADREIYNTHTHSGVMSGSANTTPTGQRQ